MHEISLVQNLFQQLQDLADANKATKIIRITMEIGPQSGVVVDSFQFGFDILSTDDELLNGAKLDIEIPPVKYRCTDCGYVETITTGNKPEECSKCGELLLIPQGGEGLILLQVEME